jgi:hypothetical protein
MAKSRNQAGLVRRSSKRRHSELVMREKLETLIKTCRSLLSSLHVPERKNQVRKVIH